MIEKLKTTAIYSPKSIGELTSIIAKNSEVRIFAGGTDLMSNEGFYPNTDHGDLVTLSQIPDMNKILHNDKYIEVGAMVTLQQFLNAGANSISKELSKAISSIGSSIIRNQATIGGCLCSRKYRYSLCSILACNQSIAEVRVITHLGKKGRRFKVSSRWIPVAKLYNEDGNFLYADDAVLTRIRIPIITENLNKIYSTLGSPVYDRENCLMFAMQYSVNQTGTFTTTSLSVSTPSGAFFYDSDFNNLLTSVSIPISIKQINKVCSQFSDALTDKCPGFSPLLVERSKRMLKTVLFKANTTYLSK